MEIADGWHEEEIGRSRGGLPLKLYRPAAGGQIDGLLIAGIHGEEPETLLLARRLLERIDGTDTNWAILPCANPDGVLHGVRQNAAGVVWVNCFDAGDITTPFGGFKQSGFGRDKSLHAMEKYTDLKLIWLQLD